MQQVKCLELIFDNAESMLFHKEYIGVFKLTDLNRTISRKSFDSINESFKADTMFLQLSSESNNIDSYITHYNKNLPFDRLQHNDLRELVVHYEDGSLENILFEWEDLVNERQFVQLNDNTGDIFISISDEPWEFFYDLTNEKETKIWNNIKDACKQNE